MRVYRAEDPVTAQRGAGTVVADLDRYHKVLVSTQRELSRR